MLQYPYTPPIYKRDTKGKLRVWYAEYDPEGGRWRAVAGLDGGNLVQAKWTECTTKNPGKANERLPREQCQLEAFAARDIKLRQEYHSTPECTDWKPPFPMLAEKWDEEEGRTLDITGHTLFSQPKLDGVRCLTFVHNGRIVQYSREGQPFPEFTHIVEALRPFFHQHPQVILDGELYNHEFQDDFNAIVSAVKRGDQRGASLLQYHVYDRADGTDRFSWRMSWLKGALGRLAPALPIVLVQTHLVSNPITLNALRDTYLEQGYEGQILRRDMPYEQGKRSKTLLKRKVFMDEEFELVGLEEGVGNYAGCAKRAFFKMKDGRLFGAQVKGARSYLMPLMQAWKERDQSKPLPQCTVKFFNYTPAGLPRFPTVKHVWWEGRDV